MTLSSEAVLPIGTVNYPSRLSQRYLRRRSINSKIWRGVASFIFFAMVSSFLSRHFSRSTSKIFCQGWTLPSQNLGSRHSRSSSSILPISIRSLQEKQRNRWSILHPKETNAIGFRRASISTVTSTSSSTTLFMVKAKTTSKWEVGDLVQILPKHTDDGELPQKGEVVSIRGGGWYSIRLLSSGSGDSETTLKCRGTRLERLAFDINDGKALPNPNLESTASASSETSTPSTKTLPLNKETGGLPSSTMASSQIDHGEQSKVSIPTIIDLDAYFSNPQDGIQLIDRINKSNSGPASSWIEKEILEQAAHHATYEHWVAFTDLHCSPSTLDTCLEVLDIVHQTALDHPEKCGVLFLGDFWHHRGTLRVDCLNAVLGAFSKWQVPLIMIPGNHDQVTLGGDNHGLTPLTNTYRIKTETGSVPGPMILSTPTLFRKGLFVPHIRNFDTLRAVVRSQQAQMASALFLHAEVKGAMMNDRLISTNGISPSVFPSEKHIYSGHFHKPHLVQSNKKGSPTIEYIGSPYQVSLAEAHQEKFLMVLDKNWKCQEKVPIAVGRRHFRLSSVEELETIRVMDRKISKPLPMEDTICVQKGDRIVLTHSQNLASELDTDAPWKAQVQSLREQGLMVEVREATTTDTAREHPLDTSVEAKNAIGFEELAPESVWKAYLDDALLRDSIHTDDEQTALLQCGLEILEEIQDEDSSTTAQVMVDQRDLKLTSLSVAGFGPFEEEIDYPLDNRGMVLLRGSNSDSGPDSNGTGKSSLAMATLWALTGSLDARSASDLKVADVVNDNSKLAKVTLEGFINDSPFEVTRTKTASRGGDLTFTVNDEDLTTQSVKETQAILEEKLGVNTHILTRVAFYGQHGMNDLLEATDSKLKEELSMVVPLELWQQATSMARAKSREARKKVDEIGGMLRLRKSDIDALSMKVARAEQNKDLKQRGLIEAEERLNRELERIQNLLDQTSSINMEELQKQLDATTMDIQGLNDRQTSNMQEKEIHLKPLEDKLLQLRDNLASLTRKCTQLEMDERSAKQSYDSAKMRMTQIQQKWSLDVSHEIPSVLKAPEYCPTCKQPLHSEDAGVESEEHLQNVQITMETEIREAQEVLAVATDACKQASAQSSEFLEILNTQETAFRDLQTNHQQVASEWNEKFQKLQDELVEKRKLQNSLTSKLSMVVKESQLFAAKESAKSAFNAEKLNANHANDVYNELQQELTTAEEFLKKIQGEQKEEENRQVLLASVGERFGQKGVQTFLLQNTVDSLQSTAQVYLSSLSEDSQRLELSLDAGDKILRSAYVRGADGEFRQRPLSTLSGGQWRRCSLALSLAFAELVASRGRLRSSLLVLDEPLTHLDRSGRARFGELVRGLLGPRSNDGEQAQNLLSSASISTAIVILQDLSAEELEEAFDCIDTVVRKDGKSRLSLDEMTSEVEF